jgi:hypothetical protein
VGDKPIRVSNRELAKAVENAVEKASANHSLEVHLFQQDFVHLPWWIIGRVLRDQNDLTKAHELARSITKNVKLPGIDLQPATICIDKDILVGFIERNGGAFGVPGSLGGSGGAME